MATWGANQYLKFAEERGRPFFDLLAQVRLEAPAAVADLGCGTGSLTRTLADRWPRAYVVGVDNSADMLKKAEPLAIPGRLEFVLADLIDWSPTTSLDLIVSNAAFHWIPDHEALLARLAKTVAPGGMLAVQMPHRFQTTSQQAVELTSADPRWAALLEGVGLSQDSVKPVEWYVRELHKLGFTANAWETTYVHVLIGDDPVLEWLKGTGLRPLLDHLGPQQGEFLTDLGTRLREAYPEDQGVTLFPFPRLFFVATQGG
jgi:trans-aconitate 2-methyltransferase